MLADSPDWSSGKYCISCGESISEDARLCPECGVTQLQVPSSGGKDRSADEKYCTSCGSVINRDAELCPECGVRQSVGVGGGSSEKDRVAAGVLALLLGGLGVHKFYLGETTLGIIYLCFSWTLIPSIIGFIEGILYLTKTDEGFQREYVDG
jgi:TM2 domain-containing membrane protein YozV/RNA polymerase subunit RPABC4/transcription elongation factor Spt4